MALGIDVAWSRPDPAQVKAHGYSAVIGYLSHDSSKELTRAYIDACHAQGLDVGLVFEDSAQRAAGGSPAGQADGAFVAAELARLGVPAGVAVYYAVDFAAPVSDQAAIVGYFHAAGAQHPANPAGAYGDADVINWAQAGGIHELWQTVAWSAGRQDPGLTLFQRVQQDFGGGADVDEIRAGSWGQWAATPTPAPKPLPAPAGPVFGSPMEVDVNIQPVTVTVQIQGGHGWCAAPAPSGRMIGQPVPVDLDPAQVGTYVKVPAFSGITPPTPDAPNGKLVFGKPGDGDPTDGNYSYVVSVVVG